MAKRTAKTTDEQQGNTSNVPEAPHNQDDQANEPSTSNEVVQQSANNKQMEETKPAGRRPRKRINKKDSIAQVTDEDATSNEVNGQAEANKAKSTSRKRNTRSKQTESESGNKSNRASNECTTDVLRRQFELQVYINTWYIKAKRHLEVDAQQFQEHMTELIDIDMKVNLSGKVPNKLRQQMDKTSEEIDEILKILSVPKQQVPSVKENEPVLQAQHETRDESNTPMESETPNETSEKEHAVKMNKVNLSGDEMTRKQGFTDSEESFMDDHAENDCQVINKVYNDTQEVNNKSRMSDGPR